MRGSDQASVAPERIPFRLTGAEISNQRRAPRSQRAQTLVYSSAMKG